MQILWYGLLILSSILGLGAGGLGCVLGFLLTSSFVNTDKAWGWAIIAFSLSYIAHPVLMYWLQKKGHDITAMIITLVFIIFSGLLLVFLPSAIEAGARP